MNGLIDFRVLKTISLRTLSQAVESPVFYVVAMFFYGFVGSLFGINYFLFQHASIIGLSDISPWVLWFVVPALTMGSFSEEFRMGTFEHLATLPVRDWELVLGKFLGFSAVAFLLTAGLFFYVVVAVITAQPVPGIEWGASIGVLAAIFLMCLSYGAIGIFASSLTKNQVVSLIIGMVFCTLFFFANQFSSFFPGFLSNVMEMVGIGTHMQALRRGVWDIRDLFYFFSLVFMFLYLTVRRLSTRRM